MFSLFSHAAPQIEGAETTVQCPFKKKIQALSTAVKTLLGNTAHLVDSVFNHLVPKKGLKMAKNFEAILNK